MYQRYGRAGSSIIKKRPPREEERKRKAESVALAKLRGLTRDSSAKSKKQDTTGELGRERKRRDLGKPGNSGTNAIAFDGK